jgi:hypothetical protein
MGDQLSAAAQAASRARLSARGTLQLSISVSARSCGDVAAGEARGGDEAHSGERQAPAEDPAEGVVVTQAAADAPASEVVVTVQVELDRPA